MKLRGKTIFLLAFCFSFLLLGTLLHRRVTLEHHAHLENLRLNLYPASYLVIEAEHLLGLRLKQLEEAILQDDESLIVEGEASSKQIFELLGRAKLHLGEEQNIQKELSLLTHHIEKAMLNVGPLYSAFLANQLDEGLQAKVLERGQRFNVMRERVKEFKWRSQQLLDSRLQQASQKFSEWNYWITVMDYLIVFMFIWVAYRIYKTGAMRVGMLAASTRRLSEDLGVPIELDATRDEVGELSHSLDVMKASIIEQQQALKERTEQAEEALRVKGDFLSNMSHELRTPLNAILGMADVLYQFEVGQGKAGEFKSCVESIDRAGHHLLELINDVLDLSKLEAGKVTLKNEHLSVRQLFDEMKLFFKAIASERGNELEVELPDEFPSWVVSDPKVLRQVLTNLIGNAIKFTKDGQVCMFARMEPDHSLVMGVRDTGMGISDENVKFIFEQFRQVEAAHTKNVGGTGLGLAICRQLSQLLGGEISVRSELGVGSEFFLRFTPVDFDKGLKQAPKELKPLKILVAEDNEDNTLLLKMYFKKQPHEVAYCENGLLALEYFKEHVGSLDLVISDMQMPVMDGYTSVQAMRAHELELELTPMRIVALTAFTSAEDREKCLASGCDKVEAKPVSKKDFLKLLECDPYSQAV